MNTLAVVYGNGDEIKKPDPDPFLRNVQGIRLQGLFELVGSYEKVWGEMLNTPLDRMRPGQRFDQAIGNKGVAACRGEMRMANVPFLADCAWVFWPGPGERRSSALAAR